MDIFLHIPKTAGTTLGRVLRHEYGYLNSLFIYSQQTQRSSEVQNSLVEKSRNKTIVWGHLNYGIHKHISPDNYRYFTILREPVDRVISHYFYAKREPTHYLYETINKKQISLLDYVSSNLTMEIENGQCRQLCGVAPDRIESIQMDAYKLAESNLNGMAAVGLTENFEDSLRIFKNRLGWQKKLKITRANVTAGRPQRKNVDAGVLQVIMERNEYDLILYKKAEEIFNAQLSELRSREVIHEIGRVEALADKLMTRFFTSSIIQHDE